MRNVGGFLAAAALAACSRNDKPAKVEQARDPAVVVDSAKHEAPLAVLVDSGSPRLILDSTAKEPALEFRDHEFIVRLPLAMARVLFDSLPGFTPLKRAAFHKDVLGWMDHYADRLPPSLDPADSSALWATALSVVVGDFNGDSKLDIAMEGISGDVFAMFFLLSPSDTNARPSLLYFHPPSPGSAQYARNSVIDFLTLVHPGKVTGFDEEGDPPVVELHTDAVEYEIFEKASELYYIEKGVVQILATSD